MRGDSQAALFTVAPDWNQPSPPSAGCMEDARVFTGWNTTQQEKESTTRHTATGTNVRRLTEQRKHVLYYSIYVKVKDGDRQVRVWLMWG